MCVRVRARLCLAANTNTMHDKLDKENNEDLSEKKKVCNEQLLCTNDSLFPHLALTTTTMTIIIIPNNVLITA